MAYQPGDENLDINALTQTESGLNQISEVSKLISIYPNPAGNSAELKFNIPENGFTDISLYDLNGKLVKKIINTKIIKGRHTITLDLSGLKNGLYSCRLQCGNITGTEKLSVIR
jgi:hypothetical protein